LIPFYGDLQVLFSEILEKQYGKKEYIEQFTTRVPENIAKMQRMEVIFRTRIFDTPTVVFTVLKDQEKRLMAAQQKHGEYISPEQW